MKKFFKYFILPAIILVGIYMGDKSITGKSTFNSLYLVPQDAAMIIESEDVFHAWNEIVHSDAWYHLQNIESLAELNAEIQSIDSLINNNKLLFRLAGNRKVTFSYHHTQYNNFDFLLIADIGKATRIKNLSGLLKNLLGDGITINSRKYQEQEIIEIHDRTSGEIMYLSFIHDKAVFSFSYLLVEHAIKEQSKMSLARNLKFLEVYEKTDGKGLFTVYLNHERFLKMLEISAGMSTKELKQKLKNIFFSGLYFNISSDGLISLEGYASYNDTISSNVFNLLETGKSELYSKTVIPGQLASATKINIDNAIDYFHKSLNQNGESEYKNQITTIEKLEKKLNIDVEENILSWIDDEIVLVQTKPSNLGKANEFAAILHAKNEKAPRKNLELVYEQIKKNSPIKVKKVNYQGFDIAYISMPGLLKMIFGKLLDKIEMPYITQIEDNVIISNHPQVLKNIIDDYLTQQTLANNIDYYNFTKHFKSQNAIGTYIQVPVIFSNLKSYFNYETWSKIKKNEEYITSFSNAGLFFDNMDNLFHFDFKAQYNRNTKQYILTKYKITNIFTETPSDEMSMVIEQTDKNNVIEPSKINIDNLDENKYEQYFSDSTLQLIVDLKNGLKHGTFKEYYLNGELKIKGRFRDDLPDGKWKYYTEEGVLAYEKEFKDGIDVTEQ